MTSNIESFSYRRKTLGQLQRHLEEITLELKRIREWQAWQEMVTETLEVQFSEFKDDHAIIVDELLAGIRNLHRDLMQINKDIK